MGDHINVHRHPSNIPYNTRQFEERKIIQEMNPMREGQPLKMYPDWGNSAFQPPIDNRYHDFSAENRNNPPSSHKEMKKEEEDFERSVPMNSEYNYSERNDKYASVYNKPNYGEFDKMNNGGMNPSFMTHNDAQAPSVYSMPTSNLLQQISSEVKPITVGSDYDPSLSPIYRKEIFVVVQDDERGEWKSELIFKSFKKTDHSSQRNSWVFELTREDDPLFLFT